MTSLAKIHAKKEWEI